MCAEPLPAIGWHWASPFPRQQCKRAKNRQMFPFLGLYQLQCLGHPSVWNQTTLCRNVSLRFWLFDPAWMSALRRNGVQLPMPGSISLSWSNISTDPFLCDLLVSKLLAISFFLCMRMSLLNLPRGTASNEIEPNVHVYKTNYRPTNHFPVRLWYSSDDGNSGF